MSISNSAFCFFQVMLPARASRHGSRTEKGVTLIYNHPRTRLFWLARSKHNDHNDRNDHDERFIK